MNAAGHSLGFLRELTWGDVLLVLAVLVGGQLLVLAVRWIVRRTAESAPSHRRLVILRTAPIARLVIGIAGIAIIVPILVEPTFENVVALVAAVSLALAFALKDYASCLAAGIVTIIEHLPARRLDRNRRDLWRGQGDRHPRRAPRDRRRHRGDHPAC